MYRLPLLGNHVLLSGETGSGKSEGGWAIIDQLAPAIADGTVQLWGIDPKAMELSAGEPLFTRLAYKSPADYARLLEDAVVVMCDRQLRLRGVTRLHQPSPAEPLIVILIDELAALSYVNERDVRRRIDNALGLLLSQGRAVGITVIGAIQDPRKEVLPARDLFPIRVGVPARRGRPGPAGLQPRRSGPRRPLRSDPAQPARSRLRRDRRRPRTDPGPLRPRHRRPHPDARRRLATARPSCPRSKTKPHDHGHRRRPRADARGDAQAYQQADHYARVAARLLYDGREADARALRRPLRPRRGRGPPAAHPAARRRPRPISRGRP